MSATAILQATDVTKTYDQPGDGTQALAGVSLVVEPGEFLAIMGPSGSGKSTLLRCLATLESFDSGAVHLAGYDLASTSKNEQLSIRREIMSFVFQDFSLIPTLTARQNVELPLVFAGRSAERDQVDEVLETVELTDRADHYPSNLSGGQQQRVALARALVMTPKVIFADEPTGNLDRRTGTKLMTHMRNAVDRFGQTIVMVTHDPTAVSVVDRTAVIVDGKIRDILRKTSAAHLTELLESV